MIQIKIKKLHPDFKTPIQATKNAGGWDVIATEIIQEKPNFVICKLGFAAEFSNKYKLTLVPRSSLTKTHWILQNSPGLGDSDYRGEYQFRFRCIPTKVILTENTGKSKIKLEYEKFPYKIGDRIGQIYLEKVIPIKFKEIEKLKETERNKGGYGSTGNH